MNFDVNDFLMSSGDDDDEYGLFIMEKDSKHHSSDAFMVYCFDSDLFLHIPLKLKKYFVPVAEFSMCMDEFGNEYKGDALQARIKDAIQVYLEELPGYVERVLNRPDF